jgi:hypothetical protein
VMCLPSSLSDPSEGNSYEESALFQFVAKLESLIDQSTSSFSPSPKITYSK